MPEPTREKASEWISMLIRHLGFEDIDAAANVILNGLFFGVASLLAIRCCLTSRQGAQNLELLRHVFFLFAIGWYLRADQSPHFLAFAMPFMVLIRGPWLMVPACAILFYIRDWLAFSYPNPGAFGTPYDGRHFFAWIVVWFEHIPILLWISIDAVSNWRRNRHGQ